MEASGCHPLAQRNPQSIWRHISVYPFLKQSLRSNTYAIALCMVHVCLGFWSILFFSFKIYLFLLYEYECLSACIYVYYMNAVSTGTRKGYCQFQQSSWHWTHRQMVRSCHVDAGNRRWLLCKSLNQEVIALAPDQALILLRSLFTSFDLLPAPSQPMCLIQRTKGCQ